MVTNNKRRPNGNGKERNTIKFCKRCDVTITIQSGQSVSDFDLTDYCPSCEKAMCINKDGWGIQYHKANGHFEVVPIGEEYERLKRECRNEYYKACGAIFDMR